MPIAHLVYRKAFSVFRRELDMITQYSLHFYKSHSVYTQFGGIALDREEGKRIAKALGGGKAVILQNHGLPTVSRVDEATFWFISLDKLAVPSSLLMRFLLALAIRKFPLSPFWFVSVAITY